MKPVLKLKRLLAVTLLISTTMLWAQTRSHIVEKGETLFSIAEDYQTTIEQLIHINNLNDDRILVDMELTIPDKNSYSVEAGDSLSRIAERFHISLEQIRSWNSLENDKILVGQFLKISDDSMGLPSKNYRVKQGDTLWDIASIFSISVDSLISLNQLEGDRILPGMLLSLPTSASANPQIASVFYQSPLQEEETKGPWFGEEPRRRAQPSRDYSETSLQSPLENYHKARSIIENLDRDIRRMGLLSRDLKGWRIVLDPGHGGLDPGTIVETTDGLGNSVFVVEDEYAYDISIRLYSLLKQHGADVNLTIISPNHHIRSTPDASLTFVNQKNEVYNQESLNQNDNSVLWPRGGSQGLRKRKTVAQNWIGRNNKQTLFISIHCDNTEQVDFDSAVLTWGLSQQEQDASNRLARSMVNYLGGESEIREQELEVLKNNPASAAVLVEIRNVSDSDNSWILRKEELRNQEVDNIFMGIKDYIMEY